MQRMLCKVLKWQKVWNKYQQIHSRVFRIIGKATWMDVKKEKEKFKWERRVKEMRKQPKTAFQILYAINYQIIINEDKKKTRSYVHTFNMLLLLQWAQYNSRMFGTHTHTHILTWEQTDDDATTTTTIIMWIMNILDYERWGLMPFL